MPHSGNFHVSPPVGEAPVKEGWLYVKRSVNLDIVDRKKTLLHTNCLITGVNKPRSWLLQHDSAISEIDSANYTVWDKHRNMLLVITGTLTGVSQKTLFYFTVGLPYRHTFGRDALELCFESRDEAEAWKVLIQTVISSIPQSAELSTRSLPILPRPDLSESSKSVAEEERDKPIDLRDLKDADGDEEMPGPKHGTWVALSNENGVSVYWEEKAPGESDGVFDGAFMVTAVIRDTPRACCEAMLRGTRDTWSAQPNGMSMARVLETESEQSRIIQGRYVSHGLLGALCATRDVVLRQTVTSGEDGKYVINSISTTHKDAPEAEAPWWQWHAPIRAQVTYAGWTFVPLLDQYTGGSTSYECLATYLLKVDLGGWLGRDSLLRKCGPAMLAVIRKSYVRQATASMASLRDKVERSKFTYGLQGEASRVRPQNLSKSLSQDFRARVKAFSRSDTIFHDAETHDLIEGLLAKPGLQEKVMDALSPAESEGLAKLLVGSGTLPTKFWSCPGSAGFSVRGPDYLKSRKKVKTGEPVFELVAVDLLKMAEPVWGIAPHLKSFQARNNGDAASQLTFILQLMVPGTPCLGLIMTWVARDSNFGSSDAGENDDAEVEMTPAEISFARFCTGNDAERNNRFKLIPSVVEGSWIIKTAVGNTPVLLGNKLTTKYTRGEGWFEVDVDVGSNSTAAMVVGMVSGATKALVIDMGILIQGNKADELPEQLLGSVRLSRLDLEAAESFSPPSSLTEDQAQEEGASVTG